MLSEDCLIVIRQSILFPKSTNFKFCPIQQDYSPSTNVDQLMQKRVRDKRDKRFMLVRMMVI